MSADKKIINIIESHGTNKYGPFGEFGYIISIDGKEYFTPHKEDGPAINYNDHQVWYVDGLKHRVNGPAFINDVNDAEWFFEGKKHRIGGPACFCERWNIIEWWINDKEIKVYYING